VQAMWQAAARASVLVVDDDLEIRETLRDILEDSGHAVACAGNGQEALDYLSAYPRPRLILLDMMMPVLDGSGFRQRQLSDPAIADIPVIVMSASTHISKANGFLSQGYIQKPFKLDQLLEVVDRFADAGVER
jgi:CheY-like chemotaxis protein